MKATITKELLEKEYIKSDKKREEVASKLNITKNHLIYLLQKYNIKKVPIDYDTPIKDRDWLYKKYISEKKSTIQIGNQLGKSTGMVFYWLKKFRIPIRTRPESRHNYAGNHCLLSKFGLEFLHGELLGDGSLSANNFSAIYRHSSKYLDYLEWMEKIFLEEGIERCGNIRKYGRQIGDKIFYTFNFSTRHYEELKPIYHRFYPSNKKVIPKNLEITPVLLRQWYIGDGSLDLSRQSITIATYGFDNKSQLVAVNKLNSLGLNVWRAKAGRNKSGDRQYILRFSTDCTGDFLDYIGPCPEEIEHIYGYKWL